MMKKEDLKYPRDVPLAEYLGDSAGDMLPSCAGCGATRWAITNRRITCLSCCVFVRNCGAVPHNPKTNLYANEIIIGYIYPSKGIVTLLRPMEPYAPPVRPVAELAEAPLGPEHFDARGCVRVSSDAWTAPPVVATPREIERAKAARARLEARRARARRRPTRAAKFADDPMLLDMRDDPGRGAGGTR